VCVCTRVRVHAPLPRPPLKSPLYRTFQLSLCLTRRPYSLHISIAFFQNVTSSVGNTFGRTLETLQSFSKSVNASSIGYFPLFFTRSAPPPPIPRLTPAPHTCQIWHRMPLLSFATHSHTCKHTQSHSHIHTHTHTYAHIHTHDTHTAHTHTNTLSHSLSLTHTHETSALPTQPYQWGPYSRQPALEMRRLMHL